MNEAGEYGGIDASFPKKMVSSARAFYDREYRSDDYPTPASSSSHPFYARVSTFVREYGLADKKCLEVGCGRGAFQAAVSDYVGIDLSQSVAPFLHKPFCVANATQLPFVSGSFDAVWSYAVLEHVPNPERALAEIRRVLRDKGLLLLEPAWQCRPWAAQGYEVRPFSDFDLWGKVVKASVFVRDSVLFRSAYILPRRLWRTVAYLVGRAPMRFRYTELKPNYETFWLSDSDAVNSMDPYEAILWFLSRGDDCLSIRTWASRFAVKTGGIVFRINKPAGHLDDPSNRYPGAVHRAGGHRELRQPVYSSPTAVQGYQAR